MFKLDGKVAIVTGGSSGIGASIGELFNSRGAQIINLDQNPSDLDQMESYPVDVSNQSQVKKTVEKILSKYSRIDILINNAGISMIGDLEETSEADFDRIFEVNVKGVYNCMLAVIGAMKDQREGVILNMASVAATVGISQRFAYSATKGAIRSMTFAAAKDYISYNIRCNCVSPARVHTPFVDDYLHKNYPGKEKQVFEQLSKTQPVGRMGTPWEIAALALYLCSDEASFITGTDYPIDGGFIKLNT